MTVHYRWLLPLFLVALSVNIAHDAALADAILRDDPFRPYREYGSGPVRTQSGTTIVETELQARVDRKTSAVTLLLRTTIAYTGSRQRKYESARTSAAELLAMEKIAHSSQCEKRGECVYSEILEIGLPEAGLRAAGPRGYAIKVFGAAGGDVTITIPGGVIASVMDASFKGAR